MNKHYMNLGQYNNRHVTKHVNLKLYVKFLVTEIGNEIFLKVTKNNYIRRLFTYFQNWKQ